MKNAIIINGTTYELVPATSDDPCEDCDLQDECHEHFTALCVLLHDAQQEDHYIKRQKGGDE